ncbi:MAG: amidohydrolase family protein, partial [Ignavibacteriae bacterium]|nr:amidohydrolase family protein [Ignavibacteriota bacterium]
GEANEGVTVRPTTPEDARSQVRVLHSLKISRFHILYDEHQLDSAVVAALIDEAKKLKIFVSIQVSLMKDAQAAIDAGVSALVRGAVDERLGSSLLDQLIRRNIYYVSTLSWYESLTDEENYFANIFADSLFRLSLPQSEVTAFTQTDAIKIVHQQFPRFKFTPEQRAIAYDNSGAIVKHYVPVPMGTDVSFLPGISEHLELEYLVNAGLTPMQAIVSATAISAEYLGVRKNVGFLFTNYQADMIVLERNPLEDIRNTRAISMIIKKGKIFYPKELRGEAKN